MVEEYLPLEQDVDYFLSEEDITIGFNGCVWSCGSRFSPRKIMESRVSWWCQKVAWQLSKGAVAKKSYAIELNLHQQYWIVAFLSGSVLGPLSGVSKIEECINMIQRWASNNYLNLNPSEIEFIVFGTREQLSKIPSSEIEINNVKYQLKSVIRNLGVFLDSQLRFSHHIDKICRAAYANLRMLQSIRSLMFNDQFDILSHALVLSRIESSPSLLYGVDDKQLKNLTGN